MSLLKLLPRLRALFLLQIKVNNRGGAFPPSFIYFIFLYFFTLLPLSYIKKNFFHSSLPFALAKGTPPLQRVQKFRGGWPLILSFTSCYKDA
jgi:hypothetical protein